MSPILTGRGSLGGGGVANALLRARPKKDAAPCLRCRRSCCQPVTSRSTCTRQPCAHRTRPAPPQPRRRAGSVIATRSIWLLGSGTSSGGFARSLGGEVQAERASPRTAGARDGRSLSAVPPLLRQRACHGRSPLAGRPWLLSSIRPLTAQLCLCTIAFDLSIRSRSITRAVSVLILQQCRLCARVRACGAAIMQRGKLRERRHRQTRK